MGHLSILKLVKVNNNQNTSKITGLEILNLTVFTKKMFNKFKKNPKIRTNPSELMT